MSSSNFSSPVRPSIISTTSSVDSPHQKPTPFISVSSKDDSSNLSSISNTPSNTFSFHSSSTPHDQINYHSFQRKHEMFHQNFIARTQAAKSLDHHANSSAYLCQALAICHTDSTNLHAKQLIKDHKGTSASLSDFINITKVTVIPRTHHRIAYVMDYLHTNFHGTYILDPSCASSLIFGQIFDHIPINVIDYEQNGHNSPSDGVVIKTETMCDDVATLSLELEYVPFSPCLL